MVPDGPRAIPAAPYLTYGLLFSLVAVFAGTEWSGGFGGSTNPRVLLAWGAQYNPLVWQGETWRLLSAMFLHVGPAHLFFNGYALWVLGAEVERLFGHVRFLLIYLLAGLGGNLAYLLVADGGGVSAGASGAIFGLFGALSYFGLRVRGAGSRRYWMGILVPIAINLAYGWFNTQINNYAHLGGLMAGAAVAAAMGAPGDALRTWARGLGLGLVVAFALAVWLAWGPAREASWSFHFDRGVRAFEGGDYEAARDEFAQVVRRNPRLAEAQYNLALAEWRLGRKQAALRAVRAALELQPGLPGARELEEELRRDLAPSYPGGPGP